MQKADNIKRFFAYFIDGVIVAVIGLVPILGGIVGFLYFLLRDGLMEGSSLGKKLLNLRVVDNITDRPASYGDSVKRNLIFALPSLLLVIPFLGFIIYLIVDVIILIIEVIATLTDPEGRRLGDRLAGTRVVEVTAPVGVRQ